MVGETKPETTDRGRSSTTRLFARATLFTLMVPGTVVVLVPYLLLADASLGAVDFPGTALLGLPLLVLGAALYFRCAYDFVWSGRGTPFPIDAPTRLVMGGPYRYCRNPMYVGILAILAGEAVLYGDLRLLFYLLAMTVVFNIFILGYEERALGRQFGDAYARYRAAVPRWIPDRPGLRALYRGSFLKVGVFLLAGGAVVHLLRLASGQPEIQMRMPVAAHAILVVLPAYIGFGCIVYARRINLAGIWRKVVFALILVLLFITMAMHLYSLLNHDNRWLGTFPMWFSGVAAVLYSSFAVFLNTRTVRHRTGRS